MNFLADLLAKLGLTSANAGTQACLYWFLDEPKTPKSLLEK